MPVRPASLRLRALQWLAQREHSRSELRQRLLRLVSSDAKAAARAGHGLEHGVEPEHDADDPLACAAAQQAEVDALLDWLSQRNYLSDSRFVEGRVHSRQARYGHRRIEHELSRHGLSLDPEVRQALVGSELSRAHELWRRKYAAPAPDSAGRLRQMRFLLGRGFSPSVVQAVVRGKAGIDEDVGDSPDDGGDV